VQFSREIEVLHLAPMTSIGLPDPTSGPTREPNTTTDCHNRLPWRDEFSAGAVPAG
jgi:hypothetical protein